MSHLERHLPEFTIALRGYERTQVAEYIEHLQELLAEADDRVQQAESSRDLSSNATVGPRVTEIFALAEAEAREYRERADRETKSRISAGRAEAKKLIESARAQARDLVEQASRDHEAMVAELAQERQRLGGELEEIRAQKDAVLDDLRRLHETLGLASGVISASSRETRQLMGPEDVTRELPVRVA